MPAALLVSFLTLLLLFIGFVNTNTVNASDNPPACSGAHAGLVSTPGDAVGTIFESIEVRMARTDRCGTNRTQFNLGSVTVPEQGGVVIVGYSNGCPSGWSCTEGQTNESGSARVGGYTVSLPDQPNHTLTYFRTDIPRGTHNVSVSHSMAGNSPGSFNVKVWVIPNAAPPTETPVTPTETPVTPTETPVTPTETPVTPTETPVTPTETPVTPTETPVTPTETPVTTCIRADNDRFRLHYGRQNPETGLVSVYPTIQLGGDVGWSRWLTFAKSSNQDDSEAGTVWTQLNIEVDEFNYCADYALPPVEFCPTSNTLWASLDRYDAPRFASTGENLFLYNAATATFEQSVYGFEVFENGCGGEEPVEPTPAPYVAPTCDVLHLHMRHWEAFSHAINADMAAIMSMDVTTGAGRWPADAAHLAQAFPQGLAPRLYVEIADLTQDALVNGLVTEAMVTANSPFTTADIGRYVYREDFSLYIGQNTPGIGDAEYAPYTIGNGYQIALDNNGLPYFVDQIWTTDFIASFMLQGSNVLNVDNGTLSGQIGELWRLGVSEGEYRFDPIGDEFISYITDIALVVDDAAWFNWFRNAFASTWDNYVTVFRLDGCFDPNTRQHATWLDRLDRSQFNALFREDGGWSFWADFVNSDNGLEYALTVGRDVMVVDFYTSSDGWQPSLGGSANQSDLGVDQRRDLIDARGREYPVDTFIDSGVIANLAAQGADAFSCTQDGDNLILEGPFVQETINALGGGSQTESAIRIQTASLNAVRNVCGN